jgi:hypothetical protein
MPAAVKLCIESLKKHYRLRVLSDSDLPAFIRLIKPVKARSDHLRLWLIARGAIWFDADTVSLRPFDFTSALSQYELVGFKAGNGHGFNNTVMAANPGRYIRRIVAASRRYPDVIPTNFLKGWWKQHQDKQHRFNDGELYSPPWQKTGWLLDNHKIQTQACMVHLSTAVVEALGDRPLESNTCAGRILRRVSC